MAKRTICFPDGKTDSPAWRISATLASVARSELDIAVRRARRGGVRQSIRRSCFRGTRRSTRSAESAGLCADGDVLIVWKLDRLGRSLPHLIDTVSVLEKRGVGFRSVTEAIDTTTPGGRLVFHLFGALGQFERDFVRERTRAGLAAAGARGRKGGRKPVITSKKLKLAREIISKGSTAREAAIRLKVGKTALYEAIR